MDRFLDDDPQPQQVSPEGSGKKRRPKPRGKDPVLADRLQAAIIQHAQADAQREAEKKKEQERAKNLEKRTLPSQVIQCQSTLSKWRSDVNQVVTRVPTSQELKERTESYEGIAATEAKTKRESLLFSAIRAGSADLVELIMATYGPCFTLRDDVSFNTALHFAAARSDSHDIIRALVEAGHSSTSTNRYGWTAVDFARQCNNLTGADIMESKNTDADKFAVDVGKESTSATEAEDKNSRFVLTAVRSKQQDLIHFVLSKIDKAGRVVDPVNQNTALHYAVLLDDDEEICKLLLLSGADTQARNSAGRTALNVAETKGRNKCVALLSRWSSADSEARAALIAEFSAEREEPGEEEEEEEEEEVHRVTYASSEEGEQEPAVTFAEEGAVDIRELEPEQPRPASRGHGSSEGVRRRASASASWKVDIAELLEDPQDEEYFAGQGGEGGGVSNAVLAEAMREIQQLRAKVEMLEASQKSKDEAGARQAEGAAQGPPMLSPSASRANLTPQKSFKHVEMVDEVHETSRYAGDFSRPTTGETIGAAAIEELFYKLHMMQSKIDEHEMRTEQQSSDMTQQQEALMQQLQAKMQEVTVQQQQAAAILAEASRRIGNYLEFDADGIPSQVGKIVITVRAGHGLLLLDANQPPSPYVVIAMDQQIDMTAVAPDTRNPIWDKQCVFDVPHRPCKLVLSVLDKSILKQEQTLMLGQAKIPLNLAANEDVEDWFDLTTDEFGIVHQHAGSIRVCRRFVPLSHWQEYLRDRRLTNNLKGFADELNDTLSPRAQDASNIFGLYMMVLQGEGLSSGIDLPGIKVNLRLDQGNNTAETEKHPVNKKITWGSSKDEFFWNEVDVRHKLKFFLAYENEGNTERAAYATLNVTGFPFDEVYEDWHEMDVNAGMGKMKPRVRIAFYRTAHQEEDNHVICTYCGREVLHQFQAPHISISCPKYKLPCPHSVLGCAWAGARLDLAAHLQACKFEQLRESLYATAAEMQGIQSLLVADSAVKTKDNAKISNKSFLAAQTPQLVKFFKGHKKPVTGLAGLVSRKQFASCDRDGIIKTWTLEADDEMDHIKAHGGEVVCLHYTPDFPSKVFSGGAFPDDTIKIWDVSDFHCEKTMLGGGQNFAVNGLAAMRHGVAAGGSSEITRLYSVDDSAVLRSWDVETGTCISSTPGHELGIKGVVARNGEVITSSLDMTVKLWDPLSLECISTLDCVGDSAMALETVGNWILVAGTNSVKIWEWASRRLYRILDGCRWPILWQDGLLYCATYDIPQNIQVWDASSADPEEWRVLEILKGHQAEVTNLCWFQQSLLSASLDRSIGLWQAPKKASFVQQS